MNNSFFYPSMIKIIINLKDEDNTLHYCVKECKMFWNPVKKSLNLLYMYNFIELQNTYGVKKYRLTEDGKKLRDYFCSAHYLINKNKGDLHLHISGYKTKEELIKDVQKDIL